MRVAHIITRMIVGGAQENTLLNCQDLIEQFGDEVLLITGPALGPEGDLLEQNKGRGVEVPATIVPALQRPIHPWRDWKSYSALKRILREFHPDVVHTHSAKGGILGRAVSRRLGIPAIVHTIHGAPFHPYQGRAVRTLFRWCETYAARRCHKLISVADAMTDQLVASKVAPREKFITIYSGIDVEPLLHADQQHDDTRQELGYEPNHVVIGKIARLFHLKGHEYVIEAARQVVQRCPEARFLFIGDGILSDQLQRQIDAADLHDHFHFTGLVPPDRIPPLIGAMDILVHASLREGLARALPQALIAGKPVVSYDVGGAREVVINHETGFLLPPRCTGEMTDALIQLVADRSLRERLGNEGRKRFTEQFRHENMTRRIRQVYEQLLNGKEV